MARSKKKTDDDETQDEASDGSIAVNDAWTGMLAISLLALLIGTGFLVWDRWVNYAEPLPTSIPKFATTAPAAPPQTKGNPPPVEAPKDQKEPEKQN